MAWPQRCSTAASRDVCMSSRHTGQFDFSASAVHVWLSRMACGKHALHRAQWKKFRSPPTRQIPQPAQWNGSLLASV